MVAPRLPRAPGRFGGTDGNELLTGITAAVLIVLLLAEGVTIIRMQGLVSTHMFIGVLLLGPVALKLASTGYRFARYYTGSAAYRLKGPPVLWLRLLAPVLVASTIAVFATGTWLLLAGRRIGLVLEAHKVAFIVWGVVFGVHVLAHLPAVLRAVRFGHVVRGAATRVGLTVLSVAGGTALALSLLSLMTAWHGGHHHHHG